MYVNKQNKCFDIIMIHFLKKINSNFPIADQCKGTAEGNSSAWEKNRIDTKRRISFDLMNLVRIETCLSFLHRGIPIRHRPVMTFFTYQHLYPIKFVGNA